MHRPVGDNEQTEPPDVRGKAVLVVDDEVDVRRFIKTVLERAGMRVLEAEDGLDALRVLETAKPDLLLTDIVMPKMDGVALSQKLTVDMPDLPVLLMSGCVSEPRRPLKAAPFIRKPFAPAALVEIVTRRLRADR